MSVTPMMALPSQMVAHLCLRYRLGRGWLSFFASGGVADRLKVRMHPVLVNPNYRPTGSPPPALMPSPIMDFVGRLDHPGLRALWACGRAVYFPPGLGSGA